METRCRWNRKWTVQKCIRLYPQALLKKMGARRHRRPLPLKTMKAVQPLRCKITHMRGKIKSIMCVCLVKIPQWSVSWQLSYRSVSKRRVIVLFSEQPALTFYRWAVSCFSALHMLKHPPTMTAGGNMLSAIVENSGRSQVGVIRPGSASARYEDPHKYLSPAHQQHFPTWIWAVGWWRQDVMDTVRRGRQQQQGPHW